MRTTMDRAGRIVVPKALRRAAGLEPGSELEIRLVDGRLEIETRPLEVRLTRRAGFVAAVPLEPVEPLRATAVREALTRIRERSD